MSSHPQTKTVSRRSRDRSFFDDQARCSGSSPFNNRRNDLSRSRSPLQPRRPTPPVVAPVLVLPPVRAPAPAMVVPPHLDRFQCPNFRINGFCPARELCIYDHGYQPLDQGLLELLDIPRRRQQSSRPQNPQQPPWATSQLPAAIAT